MATRRLQRLNDLIREELADLLRKETEDPLLQRLISITSVETSPDLRSARVFVSIYAEPEEMEQILRRLQRAATFFRRELAARLNLRHTPELQFRLDRSIARGQRVLTLLREIEHERPSEER
ncbi:MAG TPA: 30S ribosome-binding factor RbfA [Chloroflexota bacterium]|jgi:ribosome-binding factor A